MSASVGCLIVGAFRIAVMRSKTQINKISHLNMGTEVFTVFFSRLGGGDRMSLNPISELIY